ncbi:MAG: NADP-dependent malic enzyme [Candidatus Micrarchaeota archaeon]
MTNTDSLEYHRKLKGKITVEPKARVRDKHDLSLAYTPGVADASLAIVKDRNQVYNLTGKWNSVAIVTDGSAVLGLGDIGPEAALPVMEGKAVLFKEFAGIDAHPICLKTKNVKEIVETAVNISPTFGAINLEDISAPRCFEIESELKKQLNIPVMHDDQWGTAMVVLAALKNSLKLAKKELRDARIVVNGIGAAGSAITYLLMDAGAKEIIICDREGIPDTQTFQDSHRKKLVEKTNPGKKAGKLGDALEKADVFIGVSARGIISKDMVKSMAPKPIVFAMANPVPEIMPDEARKAGAYIIATGRSDFPNQVNNALGFPGIFRGLLDSRKSEISNGMLLAAADALAGTIAEKDLRPDYIIPSPFDPNVVKEVAKTFMQ